MKIMNQLLGICGFELEEAFSPEDEEALHAMEAEYEAEKKTAVAKRQGCFGQMESIHDPCHCGFGIASVDTVYVAEMECLECVWGVACNGAVVVWSKRVL